MFNGVIYGNETFMVISTLLVFIMTPGLAFFYGGLVEKKNSLTIMLQIFLAIGVVGLLWIFGGFSLVFGKDINGIIGNPLEYFGFGNIIFNVNSEYGATIPFILFFLYQLMFAIITLPLMTGAMANRMNIGGWIIFLIVWMILVYFPVAHWVWGDGFLVAMVVWTIISYIDKKRFSLLELFIGGIAGLAAITPASGYVTPTSAMVIGGIAAVFCFLCVKFANKMGWDDVLDVWGTHGMGGILGTLSIGIFSNSIVNGVHASTNQFLIQLFGAALVAIYSLIMTLIILKVLDKLFNIRTTEEQQRIGLDKTLLDETYNAGD